MRNFIAILILFPGVFACGGDNKDYLVTITTKYGEMHAILYDETPRHKENFIKLAEEGQYDSTIFHRVIQAFMVQGGDVTSGKRKDKQPVTHFLPFEYNSKLIHQKGAMAAARMGEINPMTGENINPKRASNGSQFYFVQGKTFTEQELDQVTANVNNQNKQALFRALINLDQYKDMKNEIYKLQQAGNHERITYKIEGAIPTIEKEFGRLPVVNYTSGQKNIYKTIGGAPHLDGGYTVFGQVIDGLHVIDSIAAQPTAPGDKPLEDIFMTVKVEKLRKKKISKLYGYQYPEKKED